MPRKKKASVKKLPLTRGQSNALWIEEHCRVPEGKFAGRSVVLTKEQRRWLIRIYDSPTRTFILSVGRKNAKTAFSAFLLLLHLCGPEYKMNSQLISTAQSKDQAAVLFELAAKVVRMSPDLMAVVTIRDTAKQLLCKELGTVYKALSAEVSTSFGKSPAFVVHDELGQVKGPRSLLFDAVETATAAQEEPLSIIISTQAPTDADLLSLLIDDALTGADPTTKVELYTADMDLDPFSEEAIRQANPHFDDFMNQTEVFKQANDARRMPSKESSYRNLVLNQRVEARNPFVTRATWQACGTKAKRGPGARLQLWGGLDLASVSDLCALELIDQYENAWNVESTFWLPKEGLEEKSRLDKVPYDLWAKDKLLLTTPGKSIEYEYVAEHLRGIFDRHDVQAIGFDRYNMKFLKPWLSKAGFTEAELLKFIEFGQGFVSMSPALRELEGMLLNGKIRHGGNPILQMCAANSTVITDPAGNRKFVKAKASGRIDGMVALAMGVGVLPTIPVNQPKHQLFFV